EWPREVRRSSTPGYWRKVATSLSPATSKHYFVTLRTDTISSAAALLSHVTRPLPPSTATALYKPISGLCRSPAQAFPPMGLYSALLNYRSRKVSTRSSTAEDGSTPSQS